ncbi:hypothetical protein D3C72_2391330 [compost metagenome]
MLVCVPEPVCQMVSGKWLSNWPLRNSAAAAMMDSAMAASSTPQRRLALAAAILCAPKAWTRQAGKRSSPTSKIPSARCVWAPQ